MIEAFPAFSPVRPAVLAEYRALIRYYPPYSDLNFASLLSWDRDDQAGLSLHNRNLIVRLPSYTGESSVLTFIGKNRLATTAHALMEYAEHQNAETQLCLIPEHTAMRLPAHVRWQIVEDQDNHDYVLSLPKLSNPQGGDVRRFRQNAACFLRRYGSEATLFEVDVRDATNQKMIAQIFLEREMKKESETYMHEFNAMRRLLQHAWLFNLRCYGIRIAGRLRAFIVLELLGGKWSIAHFWKADTDYTGIYSALMMHVARVLMTEGVTLMNFEQDLGMAGLKLFKGSLCPATYLKKFTIRPTFTALQSAAAHETLAH